jgi:hypothetical protein
MAYSVVWVASVATVLTMMKMWVGDPLALFKSQKAWGRSLTAPWVPLNDAMRHIFAELPRVAQETSMNVGVTVLLLGVGAWATVKSVRSKTRKTEPLEPGLWTGVAAIAPQFTGQITSMLRYALSAWTGLVLIARATADHLVARCAVWTVFGGLSIWLLRRYAMYIWVA